MTLPLFQGNSATSPTSGSPVKSKSGSGLLSGLKKPFQQIKKQLSDQQGKQSSSASNLSNSSGEGGGRESKSPNHPSSFVKKSALTRSLRDFKTSLTAGVSSRYGYKHSFLSVWIFPERTVALVVARSMKGKDLHRQGETLLQKDRGDPEITNLIQLC